MYWQLLGEYVQDWIRGYGICVGVGEIQRQIKEILLILSPTL